MLNFSVARLLSSCFLFKKFSEISSTYYATKFVPFYEWLLFYIITVNSVKNNSVKSELVFLTSGRKKYFLWGAEIFLYDWRCSLSPLHRFPPLPSELSSCPNGWSRWGSRRSQDPRLRRSLGTVEFSIPVIAHQFSSPNKPHTLAVSRTIISSLSSCFQCSSRTCRRKFKANI